MTSDPKSLKARALETTRNARDQMIEVSIFIHSNPELGYEEYKASNLMAERLTQAGYAVTKPAGGLETAFVATRRGRAEGPHVAIVAEYDALPEIDQAGGHNLISGAALGTAIGLGSVLDEIAGRVSVVGCPAEQGYPKDAGGKVPLIEAGVFDDVDVVIMIHPGPRWDMWNKSRAREHFRCDFITDPHGLNRAGEVVNPLDAVALSIVNVMATRRRLDPQTVVQYVISEGGVTPNVVPVRAEMKYYVRALTVEALDQEVDIVQQSIRKAAETVGVQVTFELQAYRYADTVPNLHLSHTMQKSLLELGVSPIEEPADSVKRYLKGGSRSSTDLGNVSRVVPAAELHIDSGYGGLHTVDDRQAYIAAARSEKAHAAMMTGADALTLTAMEYLTDPSLAKAGKEELASYRADGFRHPFPTEPYPDYLPPAGGKAAGR